MKNVLIISHTGNSSATTIYDRLSDKNKKYGKIKVSNIFGRDFKKYIKNRRVILLNDSFKFDDAGSIKPFIKFIKDFDIVPVFVANSQTDKDYIYMMYMATMMFTREFTDGFLFVDKKTPKKEENINQIVNILSRFVNE